ncbi:Nucleolar pre-ribosomal-associated protein 1 [Candida parapsilosis]|nr:Nucleolar pre-ribosomal-associated protein 1 [Candida parapsilosis]KAI5908880.1 Nucleolar pre-ribosomal-associated protein 1 [Candida parapsilosis]
MSEAKKRKVYTAPSVNVDHSLVQLLSQIQASTDNLELISRLIQQGDLGRTLPIWSYYSSVNNHKEFVDITNKLNHVLRTINEHKDTFLPVRQFIVDFAKDVLINYTKITYRALSSLKPSSTNPTIRLLDNLINYDSIIVQKFLNSFDLTLPVLPKLMTPSKIEIEAGEVNDQYSIRSNFMKLWIDLCSNAAYYHRLDLLTNHSKIVKNIWKYLQYDTINSLLNLIQFLNDKLLDERNFKKAQKCKILNDSFMYKVHFLFNKIKEPFFLDFMTKVATDFKNGLVFANDKLWTQNSDVGVVVDVNNKHFKIANKLLYTLLTSLKPTDSNKQLQFIVKVLSCCQELIPPYMNYLVQHGGGYHDPSLTSWWILYTLLYTNVLQIPMPQFETNVEFIKFDVRAINESIVFAPLLKGALVEGLSSKTGLTVQLTLQLILFILKRLQSVIDVVNKRQELTTLVFNQLPDITLIAQQLSAKPSKLTHLTALTIMNQYKSSFPSSLNKSSIQKLVSSGVSEIVSKSKLSNYDLSILDLYMNLQNQDFKWWNKTNGANSFYTLLIKLASKSTITSTFATKIYHLLNRLSQDKMFFNNHLLVTPIMSLIYSLEDSEMTPEFWNMFDEVVARCVRSPYKYLDLSHEKYHDESIFVVAMFEQFKFLLGKGYDEANLQWLFRFLRYLIVLGGDKDVLASLVDQLDVDELVKKFNLDKMLEFESSMPIDQDSSIMEVVYNSSVTQLAKNPHIIEKKLISSNLDYLAVLALTNLVLEKEVSATQLITVLFTKLWGFLTNSSQQAIDYFTSELVWRKFLASTSRGDAKLVIQLYGEAIKALPNIDSSALSKFVFDRLSTGQVEFIDYVWLLDKTQLKEITNSSDGLLFESAVAICIDKQMKLDFAQFWKLLMFEKINRIGLLTQLLELNLVELTDSELRKVVDEIVAKGDYDLLPVIIGRYHVVSSWLLEKNLKDDVLNCLIVSSSVQNHIDVSESYMKQILAVIQSKLKSKTVEGSMWDQILVILSSQTTTDQSIAETVLDQINFKQTTNPVFINFIGKYPQNDKIKTWIHKSMLYITKSFAESESLSAKFESFINSVGDYIFEANVWNSVPASILNTQLEVILQSKFINNDSLKYVVKLLINSSKSTIDFQKLFQIALTSSTCLDVLPNEQNASLRFYSALIIYILYNFDHSKLSNLINLKTILEKYQGLNRSEDLLLKYVLQKMEAKLSISWIASVSNWEFSDQLNQNEIALVDMDKSITKKNEQFTVSLNKGIIQNSLNSKGSTLPQFGKGVDFWLQVEELEKENQLKSITHFAYDCEFLYMIILNNDELLKYTKHEDASVTYSFNIKNLIDTGILQFIIANLSNTKYLPIAKIILNKILTSIDDETNAHFKDKNIFKVYLSNVCFTLQQQQQQQEIPKLIWFVYSQFVPILSNPAHFLYELSFRYVLAHPSLNKWDIPLFNSIIHPTDSSEWVYRELNWIIDQITNGLESTGDLSLITKTVIEFVLNLFNCKTLNMKLKVSILRFIYTIQGLDHGSDLLITRFGILSYLEMLSNELQEPNVFNEQLKVNMMEILSRFEVSVGKSDRVNDWTGGQINENLKQIVDKLA